MGSVETHQAPVMDWVRSLGAVVIFLSSSDIQGRLYILEQWSSQIETANVSGGIYFIIATTL